MREMLVGHNGGETLLVFSGHSFSRSVGVKSSWATFPTAVIDSLYDLESCIHLSIIYYET